MRARRGFTLIEIMVTIVVTSVVALLAYGTARIGFDTNDRLERYRDSSQAQVLVRNLLIRALRHPAEGGGAAMNDTLFAIDGDGGFRFLSRGMAYPLGTGAPWQIAVTTGRAGVHVRAAPPGSQNDVIVNALWPEPRGMRVRVLDRTASTAWQDRWRVAGRVPAAVWVEFVSATGVAVAPPLVVHTTLDAVQ